MSSESINMQPACSVFGTCGGCAYQDIEYEQELKLKSEQLQMLLSQSTDVTSSLSEVVPSPCIYHYRHRLDLKLKKTKEGKVFVGFTPREGRGVIPVDECPIAMKPVSEFIPQLKIQAEAKLTPKYRQANLVVRCGDDARVFWGGIGKKSLCLDPDDYLWTEINERKIFYSLDTFFQANLSILPRLFEEIKALNLFDKQTTFFDLYGGVGLFGIGLIDLVKDVVLIENCKPSVALAHYNVSYHKLDNFEVVEGTVEQYLPKFLDRLNQSETVAIIDPPRAGLSEDSLKFIVRQKKIGQLLYLSCNPGALVRDLRGFIQGGWVVDKVMPFDFFPRTKHLETLVVMKP